MIRRFAIATGIVVSLAIMAILAFHFYRVSLCNRILDRIDSLGKFPPSETTGLEWAVHVYWTHNLHCNSMPLMHASTNSMRSVDTELSDALDRGPDLSTIDSLWDRYAEMTPSGAEYRLKYESEKDRIARVVAEQGLDFVYIDDYLCFSASHNPD
ncbi:hypothetical protein [Rhodopirellula sp. SWK7]|uniref:hypothetical protein n=1 Tax=Rhodopirellula sp. SWK7 TaxID=595460 RepID=UPI0002C03C9B|nr:hypothetical protein [Rhodopirellula sp. SWK7]EMI41979.1 membrane or secreted protein [Rhodopirellula sp. SWK7]